MTAPRTSHPESSAEMKNATKNTKTDVPISNDALAALLIAVAPVKLPAARKAAMKSALLAQLKPKADHTRVSTLRARDDGWKPLAPKVDMQVLLDDGFTASWLVRVAAGGRIPSHEHSAGHEEFLVMSGACTVDGEQLKAGDFQIAARGSKHIDIFSAEGCLLFVRSPSFKAQSAARAHA